jgi:DNA adenine methylase
MHYLSPLRYPGGKADFAPYLARLAAAQSPRVSEYAEPFAGGAGAALRLLVDEEVNVIYINDLNPGIAAMWESAIQQSERFAQRIRVQVADLDAWHAAREIYLAPGSHDRFELGFATFLLNRWNRSGIITARPIGGLEQTGNWKIDARFNRLNLADRVEFIGGFEGRIRLTQLDARAFLDFLEAEHPKALTYVDPPYLAQGDSLYFDSLTAADHRELAAKLGKSALRWFLTYDVDERVTAELYGGRRCVEFSIAHTAQKQHVGTEYAIYSDSLTIPDYDIIKRAAARGVTA